MKSRYQTDIRFPNLTAMTRRDLETFAVRAHAAALKSDATKMHGARGDWLRLAALYARNKLKAMTLRAAGDNNKALRYEAACENIYAQIPVRMKW